MPPRSIPVSRFSDRMRAQALVLRLYNLGQIFASTFYNHFQIPNARTWATARLMRLVVVGLPDSCF